MKKQELQSLIREEIQNILNEINFGIKITNDQNSIRNKTLGVDSLKKIQKTYNQYKSKGADTVDNMVANTNQNLTNKQIAQAYVKLGIYNFMKDTDSVKRALKRK